MIDQEAMNRVITAGLKAATGCEVVKSNIANAPIPPYPYISFTVTRTATQKGTYGVADGVRTIGLQQTWSITVQSEKDNETQRLVLLARDWLEETGMQELNDAGIVVQSIGDINNRDTLLSVGYEYRKGFDAVFSMANVIQEPEMETIETINFNEE